PSPVPAPSFTIRRSRLGWLDRGDCRNALQVVRSYRGRFVEGWVAGESYRHEVVIASPESDRILMFTRGFSGTVNLIQASTGRTIEHPGTQALSDLVGFRPSLGIQAARFSADGRQLVTVCTDGTARIWSSRTGEPLTPPLRESGPIRSAALSPDGR